MAAMNIERRLAALEADGTKANSCIEVLFIPAGASPEEAEAIKAQAAALEATTGRDVVIVNFVQSTNRETATEVAHV